MAINDVFGTISFHDAETGLEAKLRIEKEITNNYNIKLPVDLQYNATHSVDDDGVIPCITLISREEVKAVLDDLDRRVTTGWKEFIERQILGENDLEWVPANGKGYIRQLHDKLRKEIQDRIEADNEIKTGDKKNDQWDAGTANLNKIREDVDRNSANIEAINQFNAPVGFIVPTLIDTSNQNNPFTRSYVRMMGQTVYASTYDELINVVSTSSKTATIVPETENINNIKNNYQELMTSIYNGYTTSRNTPTRLFMSIADLVKLLGGNSARGILTNKQGEDYRVGYGGNTQIIKNMAKEYYLFKYGEDSQYAARTKEVINRNVNKITLEIDQQGYLRYRKNDEDVSTTVNMKNVNGRNGYIQIVTISNGGLILEELVYIRNDNSNGSCVTTTIDKEVLRAKKELRLYKEIGTNSQDIHTVSTRGYANVTIETITMPLTNEISSRAGRTLTLPDMSQDGIFMGGGNSVGQLLDWTMPNIQGRISTPYKSWYVCDGVFRANGSTYFNSRDGGGDPTFIGNFDLNNLTQFQGHTNNNNLFYPKHYSMYWWIKARSTI